MMLSLSRPRNAALSHVPIVANIGTWMSAIGVKKSNPKNLQSLQPRRNPPKNTKIVQKPPKKPTTANRSSRPKRMAADAVHPVNSGRKIFHNFKDFLHAVISNGSKGSSSRRRKITDTTNPQVSRNLPLIRR